MTARYVAVTGSVGAGATTLAELIAKHWISESLLEGQIESINPFFKDSQDDPARWIFHSQAHFLATSAARHRQLRELQRTTTADILLEDRTPFEHHGAYSRAHVAQGTLHAREYALLGAIAAEIERGYVKPDLLIYREMSATQIVERVKVRGRAGESVDADRLRAIHAAFGSFIQQWNLSEVIHVPAEVDILTDEGKAKVIGELSTYLGQPTR